MRSKHRWKAEWGAFGSRAEVRRRGEIAKTLTRCDPDLVGETTEIEFALLQTYNPVPIAFHELG